MNKTKPTAVKPAPADIRFVKGRKQVTINIANTKLQDWVDKQEIQMHLHISNRTLQNLRSRKQIPWSVIGGKILYYLPGILTLLEENIFSGNNSGKD